MKRSELLKAVEYVMAGVDKSGSPTGMDFIVFDGKNGWVRSFNDVLSVSYPLATGINGAIKAHDLVKVLSKMDGESLRLDLDGEKVLIKNAKTTLKMVKMEESQLSQFQSRLVSLQTEGLEWQPLPETFVEGLETCLFSASNAPELGALAGVAISGNKMVSTDNKKITVFTIGGKTKFNFILPTDVVNEVKKFSNLKEIAVTEAWVHFKDDTGLVISGRRILGEYPIDKITKLIDDSFPKSKKAKTYLLPDGMSKPIERAEICAGVEGDFGGLATISLERKDKFLFIRGVKESSDLEEKISLTEGCDFPDGVSIRISPTFLKKIIGVTREFQTSQNNSIVLFKSKNFVHLIVVKIG